MNSGPPSPLHVVIGAGQIGPQVAARLAAAAVTLALGMATRNVLAAVLGGLVTLYAGLWLIG